MTLRAFFRRLHDVEITFQIDKGEVRVSLAQQVAIVFFSANRRSARFYWYAASRKAASSAPPATTVCGHHHSTPRREAIFSILQRGCRKIAVQKRGMKLMRHGACDSGFFYRRLVRPSERKRGDRLLVAQSGPPLWLSCKICYG